MQKELFGTLEHGTPDNPSISKISVHNFSKVVAGAQLKRPQWFFDPEQQGAGIVDVTTHLVDLVQWEAFPEVVLKPAGCEGAGGAALAHAQLTLEQFGRVTGATAFPAYPRYIREGWQLLQAPANGEFTYTLKGVHAKVSVTWEFEAPPGAGDTHFSVMRGTQGVAHHQAGRRAGLQAGAVRGARRRRYRPWITRRRCVRPSPRWRRPGPASIVKAEGDHFVVTVPEKYHNGHEAHFTQVTENFLKYLRAGKLPDWEVPNMITKYATIMQAYTTQPVALHFSQSRDFPLRHRCRCRLQCEFGVKAPGQCPARILQRPR